MFCLLCGNTSLKGFCAEPSIVEDEVRVRLRTGVALNNHDVFKRLREPIFLDLHEMGRA